MRLHVNENDFGKYVYAPDGEALFLSEYSDLTSFDDGEYWVEESEENLGYGH